MADSSVATSTSPTPGGTTPKVSAVVVDVGCGAGGMGVARSRTRCPPGAVVLVDAEPELLHAATAHVRAVGGDRLDVRAVQADAADDALLDLLRVPSASSSTNTARTTSAAGMSCSCWPPTPSTWEQHRAEKGRLRVGAQQPPEPLPPPRHPLRVPQLVRLHERRMGHGRPARDR